MSRVLITGINGFTGHYLAPILVARGHEVFGTVLSSPRAPNEFACDLTDRGAIRSVIQTVQPDYVLHLAAIAFVAHGDTEALYRVNLLGTLHLLDALGEAPHPIKKLVLASSANIYGNAEVCPTDENVRPAPTSHYGVSKLAMEHAARLWFDRLPIVVVRPFNYTGRGQSTDFLLPKIVSAVKRRVPVLELGNLDIERDFSDVRVVADCYARLLETGFAGEVVNVCSGKGQTLLSAVDHLQAISGYRPRIEVNPAFVRSNEIRRLIGSRTRLESVLGHVDDIAFEDTIRWMYSAGEEL